MEIKEYLLACISEEAGEIVQVVGKAHRFGLLDIGPKTEDTNWLRLRSEIHDLIATYELLCTNFNKSSQLDRELIIAKKRRVFKYMKYSVEQGTLTYPDIDMYEKA